MRQNTSPDFVGLEQLKQTHAGQITQFEDWAARGDWERFHSSHYDWWVFPIHKQSGYGLAWTVYDGDVAGLKQDAGFMQRYLRGVELVAASWGWDLLKASDLANPQPGQSWQHWPVRLFKAALSVKLFGYEDLFESLKAYALNLMAKGERMEFNGHDLGWLFTTGIDPFPGR
ncbi:MAG: hypothetical protein C0391_01765 [Anaerolinea sp.]|nr:hypothetical protein [Anaerolinea sp.]